MDGSHLKSFTSAAMEIVQICFSYGYLRDSLSIVFLGIYTREAAQKKSSTNGEAIKALSYFF